jgi:hypothetical protein
MRVASTTAGRISLGTGWHLLRARVREEPSQFEEEMDRRCPALKQALLSCSMLEREQASIARPRPRPRHEGHTLRYCPAVADEIQAGRCEVAIDELRLFEVAQSQALRGQTLARDSLEQVRAATALCRLPPRIRGVAMLFGEYRSPLCGRMHLRISRQDAESAVASFNRRLLPGERPARIEEYLHCFGCGAPTGAFVPAAPGDAPDGVTSTLCVIELPLRAGGIQRRQS